MAILFFTTSSAIYGQLEGFDYGSVKDDKYTNSFFNLELLLPSDWVVQSNEQIDKMAELGKELIAGEDKNMKAIIKASEINSANLLAVFQYEVGATVTYNPSFAMVAENLKGSPGIKTGGDYLFHVKNLLKQSQVQYSFVDDEFINEVIAKKDFYIMNLVVSYKGVDIKQRYYSTVQNGFCISAIISFVDDAQKNELEKVINSIKFKEE